MLRFVILIIFFALLLPLVYRLTKRICCKVKNELESDLSLEEQEVEIVEKQKKLKADLLTAKNENKSNAKRIAKIQKTIK